MEVLQVNYHQVWRALAKTLIGKSRYCPTMLILFSLLKAVGYVAYEHIIQIYNIPFQIQIEEKVNQDKEKVNFDCVFSSFFTRVIYFKNLMKKKCWITRFNWYYLAIYWPSNGHSILSSELINSIRHSFASIFIISHYFLSKNQNLNLHFLLARDLQGERDHHFHLLPSSIIVSWDSFSQSFGKKLLNLLFSTHFFIIFMQSPYVWFQNLFFILWSLRLQDLNLSSLTISWKLHLR